MPGPPTRGTGKPVAFSTHRKEPVVASPDAQVLGDLIARAALKDQRAFRQLYEATSPRLYPVALRILRRQQLAEDALQEAFVSVWQRADSFIGTECHPMTWLTSIVRNRAIDTLRAQKSEVSLTREDHENEDEAQMEIEVEGPSPLQMLVSAADARQLRHCLDALEAGQRQSIALAFYQGLTHQELARHLEQPLGTVKAWVRRGLDKLGRCMQHAAA